VWRCNLLNNVATDGAARAMKKARFHTLPSRERGQTKLNFVQKRLLFNLLFVLLQMHPPYAAAMSSAAAAVSRRSFLMR